ncbi:peptidase S9A, N-terminal domain-containing protein [Pavlovales sp. CCMP2436]|nr:peptidase S9A, N-terminal domain-containing protein [Pavlovales sp. CCMP2436]
MLRVESSMGVTTLSYPEVRRDEYFAEVLHGERVADPYRHLEDPDTDEARRFVAEQNALTQSYLSSCGIDRALVHEELEMNYNYAKIDSYSRHSDTLLAFFEKEGLENQAVLFTCTHPGGEPTILLDPNLLSDDSTKSVPSGI